MIRLNTLVKVSDKMDDMVNAAGAAGSASVAASKAGLMISGGAIGIAGILAMLMFEPKTRREMFTCLLSTLLFAIVLPSVVKIYFGFDLPDTIDGKIANAGLTIACGAPGYLFAGAIMITIKACNGKGIGEIIAMIRGWFGK
jgi:hypothetical protein